MPDSVCAASARLSKKANKQRAGQCAQRRPSAGDDDRERDIAAAGRYAVGIGAEITGGDCGAAKSRERAADDQRNGSHLDDIDAAGGRGLGLVADRPEQQTDLGPFQDEQQTAIKISVP